MPLSTRQAVTAPLNIQQLLEARQMGLGDYIAQAELRNRVPSLRERIGNMIYDAAQAAGLKQSAQSMRTNAETMADFVPGLGGMIGGEEAGRDLGSGHYLSGGLGLAGALIPGAAGAARKARGAFELEYFGQPVRILQNPSQKELGGFLNRTKYKAARRVIDPDTGDTYVWDAGDPALHQLVAEQLGIKVGPETTMDVIGID